VQLLLNEGTRRALLALAAGLMLLAAACAEVETGGGGGPGPVEMPELFKDMTPAPGAKDVDTSEYRTGKATLVIGFSDISLVNTWRIQLRRTAEIVAEEIGVDLRVTDAGGDPTKQVADVEDLLARGIDALVITPVAPDPLAPVIERAYDSGIPVIIFSTEAATDKYTSKVLADDYHFGEVGARGVVDCMGGSGNVIMLRGIAGVSVETLRYDGAKSVLDQHEGVDIVGEEFADWAYDKGKAATETLLAAHPDIDGVWSSGADMTRGAIDAFTEAGRQLVPMSGEHNNGFLKLWQETGMCSVAPVYPSWQGAEAIKLAVLALRGQPIKDSYLIQPEPITQDTLGEWVEPDLPDDYWVEKYLTKEQIRQIFQE
jgi:ribose transport system substrate-binding protein